MTRLRHILFALLTLLMAGHIRHAQAQTVIVHSNLALWSVAHANVGLDFAVNDYQTLGFTAIAPMGDSWFQRMNVLGGQCDYRFWFSRRLLQSFYLGPQVGIYHYRWQGHRLPNRSLAMSAGLCGGYGWMLTRRLNVDIGYSAGYLYYYDTAPHYRFTTLNLGVNVSYLF